MSAIEARYPYCDANGTLLFEVVRYDPKDFKVLDDAGQEIPACPPLVLYRLPELLQTPPAQTVYVTEGEKDTDRLRGLGLSATTNPGGCGVGWHPHYGEWLKGQHVVILEDNDASGRNHAYRVQRALLGVAASAVILPLPGLRRRENVSDWLDRVTLCRRWSSKSKRRGSRPPA